MPSFADLLKEARTGRVQIVHEFLTNFDPSQNRLHCFYEGREDEVFYRSFIVGRSRARLIAYICGSKDDVYNVFVALAKHPGLEQSLFFVDKDLADLLKEQRPIHPRLFVTKYYSIENYLVEPDVFERFCRDFVQFRGFRCDLDGVGDEFAKRLVKFYDLILPVMAWILAVRRSGDRPNLRNIRLRTLIRFNEELEPFNAITRGRVAQLNSDTGITHKAGISRHIRAALKELRSESPKSVVRGHFESWFLVEYFKGWFQRMRVEAERKRGAATMVPAVEHSSFVQLAVPMFGLPTELEAFLALNLDSNDA